MSSYFRKVTLTFPKLLTMELFFGQKPALIVTKCLNIRDVDINGLIV